MTEQIKTCVQRSRFCKRGHLKTKLTTFERVVTVLGKKYKVRECRACHALRNYPGTARKRVCGYRSRWQDARRSLMVSLWKGDPCLGKKEIERRLICELASRRLYEAIETYRDKYERGRA